MEDGVVSGFFVVTLEGVLFINSRDVALPRHELKRGSAACTSGDEKKP
jgi:hypothetical protein